jgi:hypothetical protein
MENQAQTGNGVLFWNGGRTGAPPNILCNCAWSIGPPWSETIRADGDRDEVSKVTRSVTVDLLGIFEAQLQMMGTAYLEVQLESPFDRSCR